MPTIKTFVIFSDEDPSAFVCNKCRSSKTYGWTWVYVEERCFVCQICYEKYQAEEARMLRVTNDRGWFT